MERNHGKELNMEKKIKHIGSEGPEIKSKAVKVEISQKWLDRKIAAL